MDYKTLIIIILLATTTQAYNVSRTYNLNESGGAIVDETVLMLRDNPLLTETTAGLIIIITIIGLIVFFILFILFVILYPIKIIKEKT